MLRTEQKTFWNDKTNFFYDLCLVHTKQMKHTKVSFFVCLAILFLFCCTVSSFYFVLVFLKIGYLFSFFLKHLFVRWPGPFSMVARLNCSPQHRNTKATATSSNGKSSPKRVRMRWIQMEFRAPHIPAHTSDGIRIYDPYYRDLNEWQRELAVSESEMAMVRLLFWIPKQSSCFRANVLMYTCVCVQCALLPKLTMTDVRQCRATGSTKAMHDGWIVRMLCSRGMLFQFEHFALFFRTYCMLVHRVHNRNRCEGGRVSGEGNWPRCFWTLRLLIERNLR